MPMPARLGPTVPFLPPAPWQLSQLAEKTLAPAATLPAPTVADGSFESGIGNVTAATTCFIPPAALDIVLPALCAAFDIELAALLAMLPALAAAVATAAAAVAAVVAAVLAAEFEPEDELSDFVQATTVSAMLATSTMSKIDTFLTVDRSLQSAVGVATA